MKTIVLTKPAARQLDELTPDARSLVAEGLVNDAVDGIGDVKRLAGRDHAAR